MKRWVFALVAALLALAPAQAATTAVVSLSASGYADLGAGPMLLGASGGPVIYRLDASQPAATAAGDIQPAGDRPICLAAAAHVWAKSVGPLPVSAVVTTGVELTGCAGAVIQAGSVGADFSGNKPTLPNVGANFAASGPFASYALAATLPLNLARKAWGFQNAAGINCALVFDDGTAASGAAPQNATVYPIAPGAGAGQQGGSDGDPYFKGRVQAYCASALTGNAFVALCER